ncbi:hypothetical protein BBD42_03295 [Paenibacillus sp. BIHB 4019]|uniref:Serine aminopeptidase S33 domain-containing protein n=1 Tax=Paenibacillus sp. BIHB 4019 TaxID=1870819 RepID=A0A1B2DD15_9BACL|nr:alpha/beta hydrolase [Paenibacillus sp. BIHB 4019]ANY65592.1 hypothetical protein BBD42_03295 [Paenibacillus sp. BIHB 4019]
MDGHGEESNERYSSTIESANKLLAYIDEHCNGKLFAIAGVSLGGQIVIEMLTKRSRLADKAIIESASCMPQPRILKYGKFLHRTYLRFLSTGIMARLSDRMTPKPIHLPKAYMDMYLRELSVFHVDSADAIFDSHFAYALRKEINTCEVPILSWYGSKDPGPLKEAALILQKNTPNCKVEQLAGYKHGELSAHRPEEWVQRALAFCESMDQTEAFRQTQ